jgi:hypothetical protein
MMRRKSAWTAGLFTLTAVAAIALVLVITARPPLPPCRASQIPNRQENYTRTFHQTTDKPSYPEAWRTSLQDALAEIAFDAYVPGEESPLSVNLPRDVFLFPNGSAIALGYPPTKSTDAVRQNSVEVYEAAWSEKDDALTYFRTELEANPTDGQSLSSLSDGTPVLTVLPRSEDDIEHANPAYLEFELDGTYIQISGGDSLEDLLAIANDLIQGAKAG